MTEAAKMAYAGHASNTQVAVRRRPRKRNTKDATVVIIQRDGRASPETFVRGIEPGSVLPRLSLMAIIIIGIHQKTAPVVAVAPLSAIGCLQHAVHSLYETARRSSA